VTVNSQIEWRAVYHATFGTRGNPLQERHHTGRIPRIFVFIRPASSACNFLQYCINYQLCGMLITSRRLSQQSPLNTPSSLETPAMATVREGNTPVLMIVDVQVGVMSESWDAPRIVKNVSRVVERARAQGVPVIWVQHSSSDLPEGSPQWQWAPDLRPAAAEPMIHKQFNSSFEQTALEGELAKLGATHIVLAGAATNWCVRATAYGALDRGYDLTLIKDAHTTGTMQLDSGVTIEAANVIQELNIAMTWLAYPGRKNGTATAEEVDFASPGGTH